MTRTLMTAGESANGYVLSLSSNPEEDTPSDAGMLVKTSLDGTIETKASIPADGCFYSRLSIGRNGTVALSSSYSVNGSEQGLQKVLFCDSKTLEALHTTIVSTERMGAWLNDGSWINAGKSITNTMNGAGGPAGEIPEFTGGPFVYYSLTKPIDLAKAPESPDDPTNPEGPDTGGTPSNPGDETPGAGTGTGGSNGAGSGNGNTQSGSQGQSAANFAKTSDGAFALAALVVATATSAFCAALIAGTHLRTRAKH